MVFSILPIITGFFYIVLGIAILWKHWFFVPLEAVPTYALGSLMIAYGIFRIGRALYRIKKDKNEI